MAAIQSAFVPQEFLAGYIAFSFIISLLGAFTTLVVLRERTSIRGRRNWLLLTGAAISMGGVSIFCMHFLGNRAVHLVGVDEQLRYSPGITIASFVLPVVVLFLAFVIAGSSEQASSAWILLLVGGSLAGCSVAGMHYCGQAAIENYSVSFKIGYLVGSVLIAVVATNLALAIFFVLRKQWADSWPRLAACAVFLAGAVTSMHYTAASGTIYHTKPMSMGDGDSQGSIVIFIIVISITTCAFLLSYSAYGMLRKIRQRARAQKVVLVSTIFDPNGNVMVHGSDGTLPTEPITDSYIEFSVTDSFDTSNSAFQWMFKASAMWSLISPMIEDMRAHLASSEAVHLADCSRETFSIRFRELFCVAAQTLSDRAGIPLAEAGLCYDKIIYTGNIVLRSHRAHGRRGSMATSIFERASIDVEKQDPLAEKPGQTLFLVKHVGASETEHFTARGYRFAPIQSVASNIASSLELSKVDVVDRLTSMSNFNHDRGGWTPGLHLACFAVQAQLVGGFKILAHNHDRQLLPAARVEEGGLDDETLSFVSKHYGLTFRELAQSCIAVRDECETADEPAHFYSSVVASMRELADLVGDSNLSEARLIPKIVKIPCTGLFRGEFAQVLLFRYSVPIHASKASPGLSWVSFNLFNTRQLLQNDEGVNAFTRELYHEFYPLFQANSEIRHKSLGGKATPTKGAFEGIMVQQDNEVRVDEVYPDFAAQRDRASKHGSLDQSAYQGMTLAAGGVADLGLWSEQALRFDSTGWRF